MPEHAGALRERVTFQRRGVNADGMGGTSGAWADLVGPFFARLRPINGREQVMDAKLAGLQPFELVVRANSRTDQVQIGDRAVNARTAVPYEITAIQNSDERRMYLSMIVKAGAPSDG